MIAVNYSDASDAPNWQGKKCLCYTRNVRFDIIPTAEMGKIINILDKPRLDNLTNEIWRSAERLRGRFKQYECQKVVLPMIVLRRLECVLVDWREQKKEDIREKRPSVKDAELVKLVKSLGSDRFATPTLKTCRLFYRLYPGLAGEIGHYLESRLGKGSTVSSQLPGPRSKALTQKGSTAFLKRENGTLEGAATGGGR